MANSSLSLREALISQALEDVDGLVARVEALHSLGPELDAMTKALTAAGGQYREAVASFTEGAKGQLAEHTQAKTREAIDAMRVEVAKQMAASARATLGKEASAQAHQIKTAISEALAGARITRRQRLVDLCLASAMSSLCSAAFVYAVMSSLSP
ncbi:hypothetical protein [Achromobacter spanius]|uniref:hypothetical protein n=1 Tax=Achromobacter spanius TaxID=217203 RepID=UPI0037F48072